MPSGRVSRRAARRLRGLLGVALAALLLQTPLLSRAERPNEPPYFAIRNARIVPVSGPVIERGTVVMARGLITAVGTDVPIPPEAWVIDGKGLTVYPGLVDSLTTLGLQAPAPAAADSGAGRPGEMQRKKISRGPEDRPATTSWRNAADRLSLDDKRLENWRKAGFTSAVTAPDKGIFSGQAALINLAAERPNELVLKTPAALRVNLTPLPGFWSFPGSLMGVLAYIKQVFLDTRHYAQAWALYEADPRSRERSTYDRTLEPLREAVAQEWPVLIPGVWAKEIRRAVQLGEDVGANTLLYGAHQGYEVADLLAEKQIPVLVSLKWPEKSKDADPEAEDPLRVLEFRDRAPSTPAALNKAGVRFAFYSDGLTNPKDILKNAKKAIEAGLPAEAALRAFTLSAAEIYGVGDRLGSIEAGKIANLVVTDGDLFEEKTKVKMVFIDGRKYEIREPGRPSEPPSVDLTGQWNLTLHASEGPLERTAHLSMTKTGSLSGSVTTSRGTFSLSSGWVSGNQFSFTVSVARDTGTVEITYSGTVEGNRMSGTVRSGEFSVEFTGTRAD